MVDKFLRCLLIFAILHMHVPVCRLHACCQAIPSNETSSKTEPDCDCCQHESSESDENAPLCPVHHHQNAVPCKCLCAILAGGFLNLTPGSEVGQILVQEQSLNATGFAKTQDGYKLGIRRPPRI